MKNRLIFTLTVLIQLSCISREVSYAQSNKVKLYICMSDLSDNSRQTLQQNGAEFTTLINVPSKNNKVDAAVLEKKIIASYPDINKPGIGVLDWEGVPYNALRNKKNNVSDFQSSLSEYITALHIAKTTRPNIKWGYYGIPFAAFNNQDQLKNTNDQIDQVLKECDVLCPSLYEPYPVSSIGKNADYSYVDGNVKLAIQYGQKYNKQVLPFIWYRLNNIKLGYQLIPVNEFNQHIKSILGVKVNNKGIDGLIWWGADVYYYNMKNPVLMKELPTNMNFKDYHDRLITNYSKSIFEDINK
jgi:hypothetical protein